MELRRKAYEKLLKWKRNTNHKPLILEGLRQVGKTYLAEKLGKEEYTNYVLIDFRLDPGASIVFEPKDKGRPVTAQTIAENVALRYGVPVNGKDTLLIFDEINDSTKARASLKLFAESGAYDVIATGSLLGIGQKKGKIKSSIPTGYEEYLTIYPLDFEEFVWANGLEEDFGSLLKDQLDRVNPFPMMLDAKLQSLFLRYIVIGGMPEVVTIYLNEGQYLPAREKQMSLMRDFVLDFGKTYNEKGEIIIDGTLLTRTTAVFNAIPSQLAKENKKFKYSLLRDGGRSLEYKDAVTWLKSVGLIALAHNVMAIETPLSGNAIENEFKIYMADIGLFVSMFPLSLAGEIINLGELGAYKGAIYEAIAADALYKAGFPLFYYSDSIRHLENDFFVEGKDGIDVIESKSTNGKMASAKALASPQSPYRIHRVYKLMQSGYGEGAFYQSMPHYAFSFYLDNIKKELEAFVSF